MKNQIRLLSLIAWVIVTIGLCLPNANADCRRARRPNRLLSNVTFKGCGTIGCGILGKCGKCKAQAEVIHEDTCVECLAQGPIAPPQTFSYPSDSTPPPVLPTNGPTFAAPSPTSGVLVDAPIHIGPPPPLRSVNDFYVDHSKSCDGCGSMRCGGGCSIVDASPEPIVSFDEIDDGFVVEDLGEVGCSCGSCRGSHGGRGLLRRGFGKLLHAHQCPCGDDFCNGGCGGELPIEMGYADRLWANSCSEPERTSYLALFGGLQEVRDFEQSSPVPIRGSFENGWVAGIAKGRYLNRFIRTELEYAYREADGDHFNFDGMAGTWDGELAVHTLMFNVLFEANFGRMHYISPYVGAGIGLAYFDADLLVNSFTEVEIEDPQLAWQAIAGVNFSVSESFDIFAEYRFMQTEELDLENAATGAIVGTADPEFDSYLIGIRFYR